MADDIPKDERIFEPTAKRIKEFRDEGRVAVSKDLASTMQLVGVALGFIIVGNALFGGMAGALRWVFERVGDDGGQGLTPGQAALAHIDALLMPTLALCGVLMLATLAAYFAQTKLNFAPKAIGFKLNRLNVVKKLKDLFGPREASVRVGLALAKLGVTAFVITLALAEAMPNIAALGLGTVDGMGRFTGTSLLRLLFITIGILAVLAVLDYLWQRKQMKEQMRMTRDELKKETEEEEGRPLMKHRRRSKHRELSMNRIIREVPTADVIVTNPTHYAVALRYKPGQDRAPVVVAKGVDDMALHIRAIARRHGVPIVEQRTLARALWRTVQIGKAIPGDLFQAVAEVLARVYRARRITPH